MSRQKGITPYATAKRLVDQGLMDSDDLTRGMTEGRISKPPRGRNYGPDQQTYEAISTYCAEANANTENFVFSVIGRKKTED